MAKWCIIMLVLALVVATTSARNAPNNHDDATLKDQKNLINYGGIGGYSGVGDNGLPFGGIGGGMGTGFGGGGLGGGVPGFGGLAGTGGGGLIGGAGGLAGSGGNGATAGSVPLP